MWDPHNVGHCLVAPLRKWLYSNCCTVQWLVFFFNTSGLNLGRVWQTWKGWWAWTCRASGERLLVTQCYTSTSHYSQLQEYGISQSLEEGTQRLLTCHIIFFYVDIQGARGFPGTPGLPGIKGHRVSFSTIAAKQQHKQEDFNSLFFFLNVFIPT